MLQDVRLGELVDSFSTTHIFVLLGLERCLFVLETKPFTGSEKQHKLHATIDNQQRLIIAIVL